MRGRGFTMLELLIALSLILAMAALSLPAVVGMLDERAYDSTAERIQHVMRLARAHARAEGRPVELIYDSAVNRLTARRFDPERMEEERARGSDGRRGQPYSFESLDAEAADDRTIPDGWARTRLERGIGITRTPPATARERLIDLEALSAIESFDELEQAVGGTDPDGESVAETIRLVIYLPDGTALLASDVWLSDADGRVGRLGVNEFTGMPRFERLEDIETPESGESEVPGNADEPDAMSDSDRLERPERRGGPASRDSDSAPPADADQAIPPDGTDSEGDGQ